MYGLCGKISALPNKRDELAELLLQGSKDMQGNLIYLVSKDNANSNDIFITEVWDSKESHQNSLQLESVQSAITKGKTLMTGFDSIAEFTPIGGNGI